MRKKLITAALAAAAVIASSAAAFAYPAQATASVNVRSGPGTWYSVIDTLRPGERVDVQYDRNGWCAINVPGPRDGFVSCRYLARGGWDRPPPRPPGWDRPPPRPPYYPPPPPRPPYWDDDYYWDYPSRPGACVTGPLGNTVCVRP